jgi:hypothetical protein
VKLFKSKKGFEMTIPLVISIVIGLAILAILLYMILGKGKIFTGATSCPEEDCALPGKECSNPDYIKGFVACKKDDGGEKKTGRCCFPEEAE